jgi:isocitrate dehydrogenase
MDRLGQSPSVLAAASYDASGDKKIKTSISKRSPKEKRMVGVDVFIHANTLSPDELAKQLQDAGVADLEIKLITNRGVKVWPNGFPETFCTDHWRCRFKSTSESASVRHDDIISLLSSIKAQGLDFIKIETLCEFDGKPAYSLGQGE